MRLKYTKDWFEQRIEKEGKLEIGAGIPAPSRPVETARADSANAQPEHPFVDAASEPGLFKSAQK